MGDNLGQFAPDVVFAFAASEVEKGMIWAGTNDGKVWYTKDGGGNWNNGVAPNGIDERLSVDMIAWARENGAERVSLAFAAFPEIFNDRHRGKIASLIYTAIHLGDALIALESLYRYLRKFHALGDRRYVMASLTQVLPLLIVLLSLEFMPRRRGV